MPQAIHFISIGGSAMHNLAIALQQQGYLITGSDDNLYDPSQSRLQKHGLLPAETGWFPEKIHQGLSAVVVGMHAGKDNPELLKAQEIGLPIYSYPEFIFQQSQQKQRVVIAGSHGKTTITAIILHVLKYHNRNVDYWIGEPIDGFETTVQLSADSQSPTSPLIIIEADEYASSPIDSRPKFLHYQPHIALISGIAWDHVVTYPTWEVYVDLFESLAEAMPKAGILIFDESDDMLDVIGQKERDDITKLPYIAHPSEIKTGQAWLITKQGKRIPIQIFGEHNMKNIAGAMAVCDRIGVPEDLFYEAIPSFKGVAGRLEPIATNGTRVLYRDFAQSPAKAEAATKAVKQLYPSQSLLAVLELLPNTLEKAFLTEYKDTLNASDLAAVFVDKQDLVTSESDSSTLISTIIEAFGKPGLIVLTNQSELQAYLLEHRDQAQSFLLMSAGTLGGLVIEALAQKLL